MKTRSSLVSVLVALGLLILPAFDGAYLFAEDPSASPAAPAQKPVVSAPVTMKAPPMTVAEASNSCEIVSCGMGIKDSCKVTCPANQTPKCSCDCVRSIGPMCMEHKANCRCE